MGKYAAPADDLMIVPARVRQTRGQERASQFLGETAPLFIPVRLIVDTGSRRSTLTPSVIAQLDPAIQGKARFVTSLTSAQTTLYWVRLEFPEILLFPIPELAVARVPMPATLHAFDGVIGRDLLSRWDYLLYQGLRKRFAIRDIPSLFLNWLLWR
jgi:hypothetical protein